LQKNADKLAEKKIKLVAISYDDVDVLKKFADKQKITFPLLSDPESKTIKAYGLLNTDAKGKAEGVPNPGTVILDKKGVIRAKLFHDGFIKRHTADDILKAAGEVKE
jgi:peroxiredoxin